MVEIIEQKSTDLIFSELVGSNSAYLNSTELDEPNSTNIAYSNLVDLKSINETNYAELNLVKQVVLIQLKSHLTEPVVKILANPDTCVAPTEITRSWFSWFVYPCVAEVKIFTTRKMTFTYSQNLSLEVQNP